VPDKKACAENQIAPSPGCTATTIAILSAASPKSPQHVVGENRRHSGPFSLPAAASVKQSGIFAKSECTLYGLTELEVNVPEKLSFNLAAAIAAAKIGRTRKDAQEDTCAVFAAALYDVLKARGIACRMYVAAPEARSMMMWYHSVVRAGGDYYDSMGVFSAEIYRARAKIHPIVKMPINFRPDRRADCFEDEFTDLHRFYSEALGKAVDLAIAASPSHNAHISDRVFVETTGHAP
jgi:hypothetical protein